MKSSSPSTRTSERVYALIVYERREENEAEEKALEKEEKELEKEGKKCNEAPHACYTRFPLDAKNTPRERCSPSTTPAAKLVAAKTSSGAPAPILSEGALKDQGESPKEALLNPHGIAVEPASGDVVITGDEDERGRPQGREGRSSASSARRRPGRHGAGNRGELSGKLGPRFVDDKEVFQ